MAPPAASEKARAAVRKPRQEISLVLKYLLFLGNFGGVLLGLGGVGLGSFLFAQDGRRLSSPADFLLNPALLLIVLGLGGAAISLAGCMGALRENARLLKGFALAIFVVYILLVIATFVLFLLFYSDASTGISIRTLLLAAVAHYADNPNWRDLMDYLHTSFSCCGATGLGYKDWGLTAAYNCSADNELPEACGVPPSCCFPQTAAPRRLVVSGGGSGVQCWRGAQLRSSTELQTERLVHTDGCLQPLQAAFEANAVLIGASIGAAIIPVCLGVMLSNLLGKQVEKQRYLLEREAKRDEKRRRRLKHRFRDPFARTLTFNRRRNRSSDYLHMVDETRELSPAQPTRAAADHVQELRATHLTQDMLSGAPLDRRKEAKAEATSAKAPSPRKARRHRPPREELPNARLKIVELPDDAAT